MELFIQHENAGRRTKILENQRGHSDQRSWHINGLTILKPYYQIIPEKVFECLYVIEDLLKDEVKGYSRDNLLEVISIVACNLQKSNNKAPLKMEYIKKLVPQGDKYLLALISLGIVERSGFAIKGKVSYSYTFTQEYKSKYKTIPLNNAKLQHRIELIHNEIRMNNAQINLIAVI